MNNKWSHSRANGNIDGKSIRGSRGKGGAAAPIVSAWVGEQNLVLVGTIKDGIKEHGNDVSTITAIPEL
jgi:hypothetical protein